jgi:hypothetical protein
MQIRKTVYIKKLLGIEQKPKSEIRTRMGSESKFGQGYGFLDLTLSENSIQATFIFTTVTIREVLDISGLEIKTEEQAVLHKAPFEIDIDSGLFFSYAGGYRLSRLSTKILDIFGKNTVIKDIKIEILDFINLLVNEKLILKQINLFIHQFKPHQSLVGDFYGGTEDLNLAKSLIANHGSNISSVKLDCLSEFGEEIVFQVFSFGKVVIKADENIWDQYLNLVKKFILDNQNG